MKNGLLAFSPLEAEYNFFLVGLLIICFLSRCPLWFTTSFCWARAYPGHRGTEKRPPSTSVMGYYLFGAILIAGFLFGYGPLGLLYLLFNYQTFHLHCGDEVLTLRGGSF